MGAIGEAIRRALKAKGENQTWLAGQLQVSNKQASIWCNADDMKTQSMRKILGVLAVPEFSRLLEPDKRTEITQILDALEAQASADPRAMNALRRLAESELLSVDGGAELLEGLLQIHTGLSQRHAAADPKRVPTPVRDSSSPRRR